MAIPMTKKVRERIAAGLDLIYTARDGREWLISDMTDEHGERYGTSGEDGAIQVGFPLLSIAQEAIETGSLYWRGTGWYRPIAFNWADELLWCETPEEVLELEQSMSRRFDDRPFGVEFAGNGQGSTR